MPEMKRLIELPLSGESFQYTPVGGARGGTRRVLHPNHYQHGQALSAQFVEALNLENTNHPDISISRIQLSSPQEGDVAVESLDSPSRGMFLLSVVRNEAGEKNYNIAIKRGKEGNLKKKIDAYRDSGEDKVHNQRLLDGLTSISAASGKRWYWTDTDALHPQEQKVWVEIWLSLTDNGDQLESLADVFHSHCEQLGIVYGNEKLLFPERVVVSAYLNADDIAHILEINRNISQMRMLQQPAIEVWDATRQEQSQWVDELRSRCVPPTNDDPVILVLDSGVTRHPLLQDLLLPNGMGGVEYPADGADNINHGTSMAGLTVYGELEDVMISQSGPVHPFRFESRKVHDIGVNRVKNPLGTLMRRGVDLAIIHNPKVNRVCFSAISTSVSESWSLGTPTADSAALDSIASSSMLVIIAAGNREPQSQEESSIYERASSIQNPAQAWNVVTVGAYSEKHSTDNSEEGEARLPLTGRGELSPFSTNSLNWEIGAVSNKPDVVFEGGNCTLEADQTINNSPDDYSLLALEGALGRGFFRSVTGTSPAAALCANFAARIMRVYPTFWPETVRALIVHSARWTDSMLDNYLRGECNKAAYRRLLAMCGYGVPSFSRAVECAENCATLIVQGTLRPYKREGSSGPASYNEMKRYEIPWPQEAIRALGDSNVRLRITLSYMPEPNPGVEAKESPSAIYPAYGLRYDLKRTLESKQEQTERLSRVLRQETYDEAVSDSGWTIGKNNNSKGSLHSDYWQGKASELLARDSIVVYPTGGWWKNRVLKRCYDNDARFALLVSLETELSGVDIYTPLKNNVEALVQTEVAAPVAAS